MTARDLTLVPRPCSVPRGRPAGDAQLETELTARMLDELEPDARAELPRARPLDHETTQRWTFSHMSTSIMAAGLKLGFGRYPEEKIRGELHEGSLKPLPLRDGGERSGTLYLVYRNRDDMGPGVRRLIEILKEDTAAACARPRP